MCFRDHINILQIETLKIPLELKTMNSKPQTILEPLVGGPVSSLNTSSGYNHYLGVNLSARLSSYSFYFLESSNIADSTGFSSYSI